MADKRFLYLLEKYRQEIPGCAPWLRINMLSDEELKADLEVAHELREAYGMNTTDGTIGGGVIGGWIAQSLRMRPRLLQYPAGLI